MRRRGKPSPRAIAARKQQREKVIGAIKKVGSKVIKTPKMKAMDMLKKGMGGSK
jgi:hypothetical protein